MKHYWDNILTVKTGDLTCEKVDALVNAANSTLLGGGGVDGAIHRAGGLTILAACKEIRAFRFPKGLPIGEAVLTPAGNLAARFVIHTVGPVWRGGEYDEDVQLAAAYRNSLYLAETSGLSSIAFPAISTGIYGFPQERAAGIVVKVLREFLLHKGLIKDIRLIFFKESDMEIFLANCGI